MATTLLLDTLREADLDQVRLIFFAFYLASRPYSSPTLLLFIASTSAGEFPVLLLRLILRIASLILFSSASLLMALRNSSL